MLSRFVFGFLGVILLVAFLAPVIIKIKAIPLGIVMLIGLAPALIDAIQSVRGKE
jgi:hypothetical protein